MEVPLPPEGPRPPSQKSKIFHILCDFLSNLKYNIFICLSIIIEIDYPPGASPPLKIVKFFIYGAILLKFETEHFHQKGSILKFMNGITLSSLSFLLSRSQILHSGCDSAEI